jgi:hypothetical protein
MATVTKETYKNSRVEVDGHRFEACTFIQSTLVYKGGDLPVFDRCEFRGTTVELDEAARDTMTYLGALQRAGLWSNVNGVVKSIKQGTMAATNKPLPPPPQYTGSNFGRLGIAIGVFAALTLLVLYFIWYGFLYDPQENILPDQPLSVEIPLDVMPVLPDELANVYDSHVENQTALLEGYGWISEEEGFARVPIDMAIEMVIEEGLPSW